jgi:hypothetical protein
MDKPRKKFKDTAFGHLLTEKAPHLVSKVIDFLPDNGVLGVIQNVKDAIMKDDSIKDEDKQSLVRFLQEKDMEAYLLEIQDRDSARNREIEVMKAGGKNVTQNILAYLGVCAFFAIAIYIISKGLGNMSTEESFIVGNLIGLSGAIAKDVYGYYFGSSKGSADKDKMIAHKS